MASGKIARPLTSIVYTFANWRCTIGCQPQQRWEATDQGDTVKLNRKNVTMEIAKEDFVKHWMIVE